MKLYQVFQDNKISIALFLSVGAFSAFINFSSFSFFWKVLGLDYRVAISIAYVLSVVVHFLGNRNLTFKSTDGNIPQQLTKYLMMVGINYSITLCTVHIIVEILHLSPYLGSISAIASTVSIGYLLSKLWVFKKISTR